MLLGGEGSAAGGAGGKCPLLESPVLLLPLPTGVVLVSSTDSVALGACCVAAVAFLAAGDTAAAVAAVHVAAGAASALLTLQQ